MNTPTGIIAAGKVEYGNIIALTKAGDFDVLVHGCNCDTSMGAGLAKQIREEIPEAWVADQDTEDIDGDKLLGGLSGAVVPRRNGTEFIVVNAYTQRHPFGQGILVDYDAIRRAFRKIKQQFSGKRIAYPQIGAGLARGDWDAIYEIINQELAGENHTLVIYSV